jgi:hypothetical protein
LCPLDEDTQPVKILPTQVAPLTAFKDPAGGALGQLVSVYRPRPVNPIVPWIWLSLGALVSVGLLGYGAYLASWSHSRFGPVPAVTWSGPWLLFGSIVFLFWLTVSLYSYSRIQPVIWLYELGLCIEKGRLRNLLWEQIDGIASGTVVQFPWPGGTGIVRYSASLFPAKGSPVLLYGSSDGKSGIPNLPELVRRIKVNLFPSLQSELARMFRSGLPLSFGPIGIDQMGLKLPPLVPLTGTRSVPWRNVKQITIQSGFLLVELNYPQNYIITGRSYRLPVAKIPNLELMLKIIDQSVQC